MSDNREELERALVALALELPGAVYDQFVPLVRAEIAALEAENARLEQQVADLQSGMWINCVYCGHRYGPADKTPSTKAQMLKDHIEHCPKHPMSTLKTAFTAYHADVEPVLRAAVEYVTRANLAVAAKGLSRAKIDVVAARVGLTDAVAACKACRGKEPPQADGER